MEYDKLQLLEKRAGKLLRQFKEDKDISSYTNALFLMIVLFLVALGYLYIKSEPFLLFHLIALLIASVWYRTLIKKASDITESLSSYVAVDPADKPTFVRGMLKYLGSHIKLKHTRIKALRYFFMIVFPFFLVMLAQIFNEIPSQKSFFLHLLAAALIGVLFWWIFFKNDLETVQLDAYDVRDMINKI